MRIEWRTDPAFNLVRNDAAGNCYDPDAGLAPDLRDQAVSLSASLFHRLRLRPTQLRRDGVVQAGFIHAQAGDAAHLVYVRVTLETEQEEGTGPMPGILIDRARETNAQPHVVRVHLRREGDGVGIQYFGHEELERELKSGEWWRRKLLHGRTAREYLRLFGGQPARLEINIHETPPGAEPEEESDLEPEIRAIFQELEASQPPYHFPGRVELRWRVTALGDGIWNHCAVTLSSLLASTHCNDEHFIFNCSCGTPGCADIWSGVDTAHEDGLVVCRIRSLAPRRVVVFDREQYRTEILAKARAALAAHDQMGPAAFLGTSEKRARVQKALFLAESA